MNLETSQDSNFNDPFDVRTVHLDKMCRPQQAAEGWFKTYEEVPELAVTLTDFIGDIGGAQTQDPNRLKGEHGNCGFDIRHQLSITSVLESPRLKNRLADRLVGVWKVAPIITARSGTWFTPFTGVDNSLTGIGLDRPNLVGDPYVRNLKTLQWLTPSAFVPNPIGTFGNAGNDSLEGPGAVNLDVALSREFPVRERMRFELRFEAFNLFNHPSSATQIIFFSSPPGLTSDGELESSCTSKSKAQHGVKAPCCGSCKNRRIPISRQVFTSISAHQACIGAPIGRKSKSSLIQHIGV